MKRKHIIEIAVALLVVTLLFAVMVPQFQKAQTRQKAAKAVADMALIVDAMEMYSIDTPYAYVHSVRISKGKQYVDVRATYTASNLPQFIRNAIQPEPSDFDYLRTIPFHDPKMIRPYLNPLPEPPESFNFISNSDEPGVYHVKWAPSDGNPGDRYINIDRLNVFVIRSPGYIGYFKVYSVKTIDNEPFSYVEYDPTNGVLNQGMAIYQKVGKVNQSYEQVTERARKWWKEQASQQP
jgi:type II secretory pathway pseudopilin PulG